MNAVPSFKIIDKEHERVGKWMENHFAGRWREGDTCIGLEKHGKLVAGVRYDLFNHASICMHVASEGRNWLNREFLWFAFYYPFEQLKVNVIIGLVAEDNFRARKFDENLGFKLLTSIPNADPNGSTLIYTMYKHQCKWLRIKHGITQQAISPVYA